MTQGLNPIDVRLGDAIRRRRTRLRMSQAVLAAHIGVTFQQVQKYERGVNRVAAARLVRIGEVLGLPASELLGEGAEDDKPGAAALLKFYNQIENDEHRAALIILARSLQPALAA